MSKTTDSEPAEAAAPAARRPRRRWALLAAAVALAVTIAACAPARKYEAALVLSDVAARESPSRLKATTPAPSRTTTTVVWGGRRYEADLYLPGDGPRAAMVLAPGAAETGRRDTRLVALATTLARARFAVLVPDLPNLRELKIRAADRRALADAVAYLLSKPELAPGGRVGIGAISYAVGPAILAALEPDVRDRVRFVLGVGGYYSIRSEIAFVTTGWSRPPAGAGAAGWVRSAVDPHPYGKYVLALSVLDRLGEASDRALFDQIVERRRADMAAPIGDLTGGLSPGGTALIALIENKDPAAVEALVDRLPGPVRDEIGAMDIANKDLSVLRARLILIHGRSDTYVPHTESLALAEAAPRGRAKAYVVDSLDHVDLRLSGMRDALVLVMAMDDLLSER